jgi:endonuclease/exonuclease/phosphatase family metal-dependent hydrolase
LATGNCVSSADAQLLGGKITGLKGSIVLDNSGLQQQTFYSEGEFTFMGSRLSGETYNITVAKQPESQTCKVIAGSGTVSDTSAHAINIACGSTIRIGAWNVQNYGPSKASVQSIMDEISQVMTHFDVIFIEEMPTSTTSVTCAGFSNQSPQNCLLSRLNGSDRGDGGYAMALSNTSGTTGAEKYACFYRTSKLSILETPFLADAASPAISPAITFTRPPFIVHLNAGTFDFYAVNIHTTPDNTLTRQEINHLAYVANYLEYSATVKDPDIVILGDFNSDNTYFTEGTDWATFFGNLTTTGYSNFVTDSMDTTIITTNTYTYDRLTLSPTLGTKVKSSTAGVYYFDGQGTGATCTSGDTPALMNAIITAGCSGGILFGHVSNPCTCNGAASEVSDHYPVTLDLIP